MRDDIFETYISSLLIYANKYIRDLKYEPNNKDELVKRYREIFYAIFRFYREMLSNLHLGQYGKDDCFREPTKDEELEYTCSLNNEKIQYPLNRILEYRHEKFPEYIDDYGMQTFIEFKDFNDKMQTVRTNDTDWDYELDRIFDVDRLSNLDPQEAYDLLINDIWYKN